jgi:uncharacterized membrane protein YdbT with pleckstrin-like domain
MSYIKKSLIDGETIVSGFKLHPIFYVMPLIFSIVFIGIPTLIKYLTMEYGLTTKRVIVKTGFISRNTEEMKINKIETVEIKQSVLGRILGYGDVTVTGTGISNVQILGVKNPMMVKKSIDSTLDN